LECRKTLQQCLESIAEQSLQNFELILIDDASTDSSKEIAKNLRKTFRAN